MKKQNVTLTPLTPDDREHFITDNQWAFKYGAMQEFGMRDDHIDSDGEIISQRTIEDTLDNPNSRAYRIMLDKKIVGGLILTIDEKTLHNHLEILFVLPEAHNRGIGFRAWQAVEALYPETRIWETCTPYFEKRNIHFYVNKCGFRIDQFWCEHFQPHRDVSDDSIPNPDDGIDEMFRFVKVMR